MTAAAGGTAGAAQAPPGGTFTGTLNGAAYVVDVPAGWNGTVLLWNHAYEPTVTTPQDADADNPEVKTWLLAHGYALAGIHYPDVAFPTPGTMGEDLALLSWFRSHVGRPSTTLTWGMSLGGELTATLAERAAPAFDGALPMCGETAVRVLISMLCWTPRTRSTRSSGRGTQCRSRTSPRPRTTKRRLWRSCRPPGSRRTRARLALAASLADIPGWADSLAPEPTASGDRIDAAVAYLYYEVPEFVWGSGRSDTEALSGGNPSWNVGVDYRAQLAGSASGSRDLVDQAYAKAGGSEALDADLAALNSGQRVAPDPGAAAELAVQGSITGLVGIPVLTLHDTGYGIAPVGNERSYADAVARAGRSPLLRQEFVARANHCFSPGRRRSRRCRR